jgi:hypothetical protein
MSTYIYKIYTQNDQTTTPIFSGSFDTDTENFVTKFYQDDNPFNILTPNEFSPPKYIYGNSNFRDDDNPQILGYIPGVTVNIPDTDDPYSYYNYSLYPPNGPFSNITWINPKFGEPNTEYYVFITLGPKPSPITKYCNITLTNQQDVPSDLILPLCLKFDAVYNSSFYYYNVTDFYNQSNTSINSLYDKSGLYDVNNNNKISNCMFENLTSLLFTSTFGTFNGNNILSCTLEEATYTVLYDNGSGGEVYQEYTITQTITKNPCCFSEGTKILCLTQYLMEEYRLVQDLMVGDLVKAYMNDYKPIKNIIQGFFINNSKNRSNCMYIMRKKDENELTKGNGLLEDLIVTGNHGILLDEEEVNEEEQKKNPKWATFKVDDKVNCIVGVSSKFEQITNNDVYKYYHFSLDNGDGKKRRFGVWANGILMETPP